MPIHAGPHPLVKLNPSNPQLKIKAQHLPSRFWFMPSQHSANPELLITPKPPDTLHLTSHHRRRRKPKHG